MTGRSTDQDPVWLMRESVMLAAKTGSSGRSACGSGS
jgi:hypothetical protein